MTATDTRAPLYTPDMLALAVSLAEFPLNRDFDCSGEARSRTCGSEIAIGCDIHDDGRISDLGMRVKACAVGQASAAIFANSARGMTRADIAGATESVTGWLSGASAMPRWTRLDMLAPALPHTGRHEAILLPWRAALAALPNQKALG